MSLQREDELDYRLKRNLKTFVLELTYPLPNEPDKPTILQVAETQRTK
jgi:hypothetical protein